MTFGIVWIANAPCSQQLVFVACLSRRLMPPGARPPSQLHAAFLGAYAERVTDGAVVLEVCTGHKDDLACSRGTRGGGGGHAVPWEDTAGVLPHALLRPAAKS